METLEMRIKGGEPVPVRDLYTGLKGNFRGGQTLSEVLASRGIDVMLTWSREKGCICYVRADLHPSNQQPEAATA